MSARQDLEWQLALSGLEPAEAHRMLDAYAHELAEKIRQDTTVMGEAGDQYALAYADLIDPGVLHT